jgi:ribonuclease Z
MIIDQGSGVDVTSSVVCQMLAREGKKDTTIPLVYTHYHDDHGGGAQQNALLFRPETTLRYIGPELTPFRSVQGTWTPGKPFSQKILDDYFNPNYFPVTVDALPSKQKHELFAPGETLTIDGITIQTMPLKHPGGCAGLRFEIPGVGVIVVATDYEPGPDPDPAVVEFFDGARLLLADMQYDEAEYAGEKAIGGFMISRVGWGHGTPHRLFPTVLKCKRRPEIVRGVHHDPRKDDMALREHYDHSVDVLLELSGSSTLPFNYEFARGGDIYWL